MLLSLLSGGEVCCVSQIQSMAGEAQGRSKEAKEYQIVKVFKSWQPKKQRDAGATEGEKYTLQVTPQ